MTRAAPWARLHTSRRSRAARPFPHVAGSGHVNTRVYIGQCRSCDSRGAKRHPASQRRHEAALGVGQAVDDAGRQGEQQHADDGDADRRSDPAPTVDERVEHLGDVVEVGAADERPVHGEGGQRAGDGPRHDGGREGQRSRRAGPARRRRGRASRGRRAASAGRAPTAIRCGRRRRVPGDRCRAGCGPSTAPRAPMTRPPHTMPTSSGNPTSVTSRPADSERPVTTTREPERCRRGGRRAAMPSPSTSEPGRAGGSSGAGRHRVGPRRRRRAG